MATGPNCVANTPVNHQYGITTYGAAIADPFSSRFTAESFALRQQVQTVKDEGTGSPWDIIGTEIESRNLVNGAITVVPRPEQMEFFLQCMLGATPISPTTFRPDGGVCDFYHIGHLDPVVAQIFRYNNVVTNTWTLSASDSSPLLRLEMNVEAGSRQLIPYTGPADWPALPLSITQPFTFCYARLNIDGVEQRIKEISITGNNNLDTEGFFNSCDRIEIPSQFQTYEVACSVPFDGAAGLARLTTTANVSAYAIFTSGPWELRFNFPSLFARPEDPSISGRNRILLPLQYKAQYNPNVPGETPIEAILTP
jgi:hypothetical protein